MANPTTATPSGAVDEAVRLANQNARRTTETAQAAVEFGRTYLDQTARANRELFGLWSASVEVGLKTAFDFQNAALAAAQSLVDSSFGLTKEGFTRQAEIARQVQANALKNYQANARLVINAITDASDNQ